jgi:hypothetical protein
VKLQWRIFASKGEKSEWYITWTLHYPSSSGSSKRILRSEYVFVLRCWDLYKESCDRDQFFLTAPAEYEPFFGRPMKETDLLIKKSNLLKTKRRLLYLKAQFVPRCKHFSTRL